jgi:hypothetical protein
VFNGGHLGEWGIGDVEFREKIGSRAVRVWPPSDTSKSAPCTIVYHTLKRNAGTGKQNKLEIQAGFNFVRCLLIQSPAHCYTLLHCFSRSAANPAANLSTCYPSFLPQVRSKPINIPFAHFQLRVLLPRRASSSCDARTVRITPPAVPAQDDRAPQCLCRTDIHQHQISRRERNLPRCFPRIVQPG